MSYRLSIPRSVNKRMERLPVEVYDRVDRAILALADDPYPPGCVKLRGREEWRVRIGNYWVVYFVDDEHGVIEILNVGIRRDVYR